MNKDSSMHWIYLSPHLDDAALSCGGMIWEQVQAGDRVEVWNICAGDPTSSLTSPVIAELHTRWGTGERSPAVRRAEDEAACRRLGAQPRYFDIPDCIYRFLPNGEPLIRGGADLWVAPYEEDLHQRLAETFRSEIGPRTRVVSPLTIGSHVDHRLVRAAAEQARTRLWYYPDFPYVARSNVNLQEWILPAWKHSTQAVSPEGLRAWQDAVLAYTSQFSTFWTSESEERAEIAAYCAAGGGIRLWQNTTKTV
jgi:LmbE family N-acetylglucosaminyl deacetylase